MEKTKNKSIVIKLLFSILIALALMIISNSPVKADSQFKDAFPLGTLDIRGGMGITAGPQPYLFGNYFCINHGKTLTRRVEQYGPVVYKSRNKAGYYNQEINYRKSSGEMDTEQSIAAAYYVYEQQCKENPDRIDQYKKDLQDVIWASGQWATINDINNNKKANEAYEANLLEYNKDDHVYAKDGNPILSRAQDWANFYYELLKNANKEATKIGIDVHKPETEDSVRVLVDQEDRTYVQGPYSINLTDEDGHIMNNVKTQYTKPATDLGTLIYNEILGKNIGEEYFQFCQLDTATVSLSYVNGGTPEVKPIDTQKENKNSDIVLLDASGNPIQFPKFGEEFYIKVRLPSETRTLEKIEMDFKLKYMTNMQGTTVQYEADWLEYEIENEPLKAWTESSKGATDNNESFWQTNATVAKTGATSTNTLKIYLLTKIRENAREQCGINIFGFSEKDMNFECWIRTTNAKGLTHWYGDEDSGKTILQQMQEAFIEEYNEIVNGLEMERYCRKCERDKNHTGSHSYKYRYTFYDVNQMLEDDNGIMNPKKYHGGGFNSEEEARASAYEDAEEAAMHHYNDVFKYGYWYYRWNGQNPIAYERVLGKNITQETEETILSVGSPIYTVSAGGLLISGLLSEGGIAETPFHLIGTDCTVELGGKVWEDIGANKDNALNGKLGNEDRRYGGMLVELYKTSFGNRTDLPNEASGRLTDRQTELVASTTTNADGSYHFDKLNALEKYIVVFTYNGQMYQQTYYKDNLSGGYSNAKEIDREGFNDRFDRIDSSPNNYNLSSWQQAYGEKVKLRDASGNYIANGQDSEGNPLALTYTDAWNQFVAFAQSSKSYNSAYNSLTNWLKGRGVGLTDIEGVVQYIKDCMISANTRTYPVYDSFVIEDIDYPTNSESPTKNDNYEIRINRRWDYLYTSRSDQSRNVDFGINKRDTADLALQKDVFKAMVRVNGKTQTYMYNKKDANVEDDGTWNIPIRRADNLYNGVGTYNREIRKSEYLYDGTISGNTSVKDLQVFVTYRIVVRNQSQTYDSVINEIVDYYDSNEYTFDGDLNGNVYTPHTYKDYDSNGNVTNSYINSYVGDRRGNKVGDLTITRGSTLGNEVADTNLGNGYTPIYLSGITKPDGNNRLSTGDLTYIYLTFKVNQHTDENGMNGRVQMDVNTLTGEAKGVGKRNLAEINGYSTYYKQGIKVPDTLGNNDSRNDKDVSGQKGGSIDLDSSAGNLSSQDLNTNGDIIIANDPVTNRYDPVKTRAEDDSDKAPNIKLVFPKDDNQERVITGYVYEDNRDTASDKAVVGNGVYDNGETKINGVTVQLVELVQNVDNDGIPTGGYAGEYVWNAKTWNGSTWVDTNSSATSGSTRYYSGQQEKVSPIISGPGITAVDGYTITEEGRYAFKSLPTGDLFIRFIYGDTTQTTLTKIDGEGHDVASLLSTTPADNNGGYISNSGLNAKSYNGQDYKSTTYQTNVNQNAGTFNGINGFLDPNIQNYNITTPNRTTSDYVNRTSVVVPEDGTNKNVMYYYNIGESQVYSGISDAKDVDNIRQNVNEYSRGMRGTDGLDNQTLVNGRAEVLASGLKVGSGNNANEQVAMIKEFMNNTAMVAQTGIINTEVEYNTKQTNDQGDSNVIGYVIDDVDLGLEERPVAQLKLNKEVTNLKIRLANGQVMFDTDKSVTNLSFGQHHGHVAFHDPVRVGGPYRLAQCVVGNNSKEMPDLITTYMDEELMYGGRIEATYTFTVTNVGEVDYLDKQFYYMGKTNNTDISNISVTGADQIIDYVSNNLQFLPANEGNRDWSIRTVQELTEHTDHNGVFGNNTDLVNVKYANKLRTYNNIVTAKGKDINTALKPEAYYAGDVAEPEDFCSASTQMVLSSTLVPDTGDDSMVYNNLSEIVQTSNTQGRRMKYSISGNQEMSDQSLKPNSPELTKADLVTPAEVDADSSQKIVILPPTGANKNYTLWIIVGTVIAVLIGGSVLLIKRFLNKNR